VYGVSTDEFGWFVIEPLPVAGRGVFTGSVKY